MSNQRCEHRYLKAYPIPDNTETLILGTIHPMTDKCIKFFYGNDYRLWEVLAETKLF